MSKGREVRCYDYVNHPYQKVRDALTNDALGIFQSATRGAAARARSIASELRVDLGGIAVEAEIAISIKRIEETAAEEGNPATCLQLEWHAVKMPGLFPLMNAELLIYPLTRTETQLDFSGLYEPPLGVVGKAVNAIVGYRIAEVSVHQFIGDVAEYLRKALA